MTAPVVDSRNQPAIVTDKRFRDRVRELLVVLSNDSPGLGLRVQLGELEKAVLVFPRAGRTIAKMRDLISLTWYDVDARSAGEGEMSFNEIADKGELKEFLASLVSSD